MSTRNSTLLLILATWSGAALAKEAPPPSFITDDDSRGVLSVLGQYDSAEGSQHGMDLRLQPRSFLSLDLSAGNTRSKASASHDEFDANYAGAELDLVGSRTEGGVSYRYSADRGDLRNSMVQGYLSAVGEYGFIGIDAGYRDSSGSVVNTLAGPRGRVRTGVDGLSGTGYGAHGALTLSERVLLYANFMSYDYTVADASRALARRYSFLQRSMLTLDDAIADSTASAGMLYELDSGSVSLTVTRLAALEAAGRTYLGQLDYHHEFAERYPVTLTLGAGDADVEGSIVFGGIRMGITW